MTTLPRGLTFVERLAFGLGFPISLTVALAWSPLWRHLPDITGLLPAQYAGMLEALPGTPNTGLAFLALLGLTYAALFLLREPTAALGGLAALALGTAAYPYGNIKWHLLFVATPFDDGTPTLGAWLRGIVPIMLLLIVPVVTHTRSILRTYAEKGIDRAEQAPLKHHLTRGATTAALLAVGASLLLGFFLAVGGRLLASESRLLGRNSAVVMLLVALLLVFALGIGTGLFHRSEPAAPPEDAPEPGP